MNTHGPLSREALRALELFLTECSLDRLGGDLPLAELVCTEDLGEFHLGLEQLLRGLLVEYSLEERSRLIEKELRRSLKQQVLH